MKKVLIFGGLGFIGSNFVRWAMENKPNLDMKVADAFTYAADPKNLPDSFGGEVRRCRLQDPDDYRDLMEWADVVVNFAAETHNDASLKNPEIFVDSNVVGTLRLLELCRETNTALIQISTDEVYGDFPLDSLEKASEQYPIRPSSPYSASKAASDLLVLAWARSFMLKAMVTNCTNNYGPNQHPEKLIPNILSRIAQGFPIQLYGDGKHIRDWIFVDDHSKSIGLLMDNPRWGERFNISANFELSNLELARLICQTLEVPSHPIELIADRPGHDLRYGIDSSKLAGLREKAGLKMSSDRFQLEKFLLSSTSR